MAGNRELFHHEMNEGHSAAWDQNWELAAQHYRHALEEFPEDPQALSNLGLALFELQQFDEALTVYQRLATLQPEEPLAYEKMARIYERLGRLKEAVRLGLQAADLYLKNREVEKTITSLIRVLSLQPENLTAHSRLALIYERLGRKAEAVEAYLAMASILQQNNDVAKAIQTVQHALELLPGSAEATQALQALRNGTPLPKPARPRGGTGPVRLAEILQADAEDEERAPLDPISEARQQALIQLATLLFDQAEHAATSSTASSSRRGLSALTRGSGTVLPTNQTDLTRLLLHLNQAIESQTHGDDAQALQELERAEKLGLVHPALSYNLGLLLAERDPARALQYLYRATAHPDFALAAFLLIGRVASKLGNLSEAAVAFLQALRLADAQTVPPAQVDALNQTYESIIEAQRSEKDAQKLKALCESIESQLAQPGWRELLQKARQQLQQQAPDKTSPPPLAEMLLETRSTQVIEALEHVRQLAAQQKLYSAMEEAFRALSFAPTYLPLHVQIGDLMMQKGMTQEAVNKYRLVARLYHLRGETGQAVNLLQRSVQMAPMELSIRHYLIELLLHQGRTDEAVQETMALADMHYHLADLDLARQTYLKALRIAQQSREYRQWALLILGKVADLDQQRLDWRQAVNTYEQMRTLKPDDRDLRTKIVDLYFQLEEDTAALNEIDNFIHFLISANRIEDAIQFLQDLILEYPTKKLLLRYRLAHLYRQIQHVDHAVAELDVIADAYIELGDPQLAVRIVREIIALNPPNKADYELALRKLLNSLPPSSRE
ncbi:MAG: tetratricopeptide repeat protein [Thermanaerothrix sp.]|uniref:tetratricopeptide repeat protein n=1 Tax=Thermanaerothrix sp. TaxID=2972675 RepID=UPI003C7E4469